MRKKIVVIASAVFAVCLVIWIAGLVLKITPPSELREAFVEAVRKGDVVAVGRLSIDSEGARIWETLKSGQIDRADSFHTRGLGWSVSGFSGRGTGYLDLTAENKTGLSVPFRLELVREGFFPSRWRIKAVVLDAKT